MSFKSVVKTKVVDDQYIANGFGLSEDKLQLDGRFTLQELKDIIIEWEREDVHTSKI